MLTLRKTVAYGVKVRTVHGDDYESDIYSVSDPNGNWTRLSCHDKQVYHDQDTDQWYEYYYQPSNSVTLKGSHAT